MSRLWMKVVTSQRITEQHIAECAFGQEKEVLVELCKAADLPCPMWLNKHVMQFDSFRRTAFTAEHFVEEISFDRMEIEYIDDTDKKRTSKDPRNEF